MALELSLLEQVRLQEGRLFQNEKLLVLFVDSKSVILESPENESAEALAKRIVQLAPKGTKNFHETVLYDACETIAKLLWPTQLLMVARPSLTTLMAGLQKRLVGKLAATLDPFQKDFVVREAFRRTLVNDCLSVFEAPSNAELLEALDTDIGPDDSASQVLPVATRGRPKGARSTLGPVPETDAATDVSYHLDAAQAVAERPASVVSRPATKAPSAVGQQAASVVRSEARSQTAASTVQDAGGPVEPTMPTATPMALGEPASEPAAAQPPVANEASDATASSVVRPSKSAVPDAASVAPRVREQQDRNTRLTSSASSAVGGASVVQRPFNVRRVHIDPPEAPL